eukprot:TRINITY_DN44926_c0_g1_i1.p1 TRINITY_DN44926_c0_g1~~TRINITY_DN44926_c0_g1_i1.p1  ORF type:complete len:938 (+),score=97.41 TRINITY_DN44926_c0_g1_i1:280-3093(+)
MCSAGKLECSPCEVLFSANEPGCDNQSAFHCFTVRFYVSNSDEVRSAETGATSTCSRRWNTLPLLLLVPANDGVDWGADAMRAQCIVSLRMGSRGVEGGSLSSVAANACSRFPLLGLEFKGFAMRPGGASTAWSPGMRRLSAIQAFSQEARGLLSIAASSASRKCCETRDTESALLVAPLVRLATSEDGSMIPADEHACGEIGFSRGTHPVDLAIDWHVVEAVADLRAKRLALDSSQPSAVTSQATIGTTLLQMAKVASGTGDGSMSSAASNAWLVEQTSEEHLGGVPTPFVGVTIYSLRPYWIRRAWPERMAGTESIVVAPPRRKTQSQKQKMEANCRGMTSEVSATQSLSLPATVSACMQLSSVSARSSNETESASCAGRPAVTEMSAPRCAGVSGSGGTGSLVTFFQERYGLEVSDGMQCVLEAADGASVRAVTCAERFDTRRMGSHLCRSYGVFRGEEDVNSDDEVSFTNTISGQYEDSVGGGIAIDREIASCANNDVSEPGPIRLLAEFLFVHPIPRSVLGAIRLLPVIERKLVRFRQIAELRRNILSAMAVSITPRAQPTVLRPFVMETWGPDSSDPAPGNSASCTAGESSTTSLRSHHSLILELCLSQRLHSEMVAFADICATNTCARMDCTTVALDWGLEVATTFVGAGEPYHCGRLAWIGDAALLFVTVARLVNDFPSARLAALKTRAGVLVSNRTIGSVAALMPLEIHRFVNASPFIAGGGASVEIAGKKARADSFEAVLGVILLVGGIRGASAFLSTLKWWHFAGVSADRLFASKPDASSLQAEYGCRLQWIGRAALEFHASAWLLGRRPRLARGGLHDFRNVLLSPLGLATALPAERVAQLACIGNGMAEAGPPPATGAAIVVYFEAHVGAACLHACNLTEVWSVLNEGWESAMRLEFSTVATGTALTPLSADAVSHHGKLSTGS